MQYRRKREPNIDIYMNEARLMQENPRTSAAGRWKRKVPGSPLPSNHYNLDPAVQAARVGTIQDDTEL